VVLVADLVLPGSEAAAREDAARLEVLVDHVVAAPQPNSDRAWISDDVLRRGRTKENGRPEGRPSLSSREDVIRIAGRAPWR
jgi:hypothetical protein